MFSAKISAKNLAILCNILVLNIALDNIIIYTKK